ncbi:hypothetical protein [Xanthomonas arboricola]|uniref:hypothetical protein n=1 Tax=Xanthomonas arboricola TaxID=56448 RepID=UPI002B2D5B10|nr:hypothetical protein X12_002182 [Xanthomonas arboricola]
MKPYSVLLFEKSRKMLFLAKHQEGATERLEKHPLGHVVFKRVAEFQCELVEATEQLVCAGKLRPALASLRTLLELTTSFSWLAENTDSRLDLFTRGRCPSAQRMMSSANLWWEEEYRKVYAPLSDFVHGSFTLTDFNKVERSFDNPQAAPYSALGDYFLVFIEGDWRIRLIEDRPIGELIEVYNELISAKAFDLALTMLMRASGDYADAFSWWPGRKEVEAFNKFVKYHQAGMNFLWLSEKSRLAVHRVEGRYA